jgi:nucleoside-diphosphate-sugar epimerase
MAQTAFLTGATGFLGAHLARQLLDRGWTLTALVREGSSRKDLEGLSINYQTGDVTDRASLERAIPQGVDAVFHVAASTNIWSRRNGEQNRVNIDGTTNVIEAAIAAGAGRMVHTSSFVVWGFHDQTINESTPWTQGDEWINYLRTKRIAEKRVKAAVAEQRLDAVICNPGHILGPGDRHNWSRMLRLVDQGKLPGIPPGGGAFADVREVASAHIEAFARGSRGANYLLGGEDVSFFELIQLAGELLDRPVPRKPSPAWQLKLVAQLGSLRAALTGRAPDVTPEGAAMITRHIHCDSGRAREALNYRFTPLRALLTDSCNWLRAEGLLS